jgi:hypothetical protein
MHFIPREARPASLKCTHRADSWLQLDGLLISHAGSVAQRRLARGIRINHGEATVENQLTSMRTGPNTNL